MKISKFAALIVAGSLIIFSPAACNLRNVSIVPSGVLIMSPFIYK